MDGLEEKPVPVGAIMGGIGSAIGGITGALGASGAANAEQQALGQAQSYLKNQSAQALGNYSPYLSAGSSATGTLAQMLGTPGQGLLQPWTQTFTAPTAQQAEQTPGYQFQLGQGLNAIQNSAAAQGGLLSGRTMADMNNYAQGLASENYQNTFNNALTQYQNAYQTFLNNQNNTYSRLMGLSGQGLQAAGQYGNTAQGFGGDIASLYGQQGAAGAAGTLGTYGSLGQMAGNLGNLGMLYGMGAFNPSPAGRAPTASLGNMQTQGF